MPKFIQKKYLIFFFLTIFIQSIFALPKDFVYLSDVSPTIIQDMRYAGNHNFVGRPIEGYLAPECILTRQAALALSKVQKELQASGLSLKIYDCYRPTRGVADFFAWSRDPKQQEMKAEFYPRVNKADFFKLGYVAAKSGHSRGSSVDLTIVALPIKQAEYKKGQSLVACYAGYLQRFRDGSIDMGTGYDCMDKASWPDNKAINIVAYSNRMLLRTLMAKYGFDFYPWEWWHFMLKDEPFKDTYFDFPITAKSSKS